MKPDIETIKALPDNAQLTPAEAARLFGLTEDAIIRRIRRKSMSGVKVAGRWFITGKGMKAQITESHVQEVTININPFI